MQSIVESESLIFCGIDEKNCKIIVKLLRIIGKAFSEYLLCYWLSWRKHFIVSSAFVLFRFLRALVNFFFQSENRFINVYEFNPIQRVWRENGKTKGSAFRAYDFIWENDSKEFGSRKKIIRFWCKNVWNS